MRTYLLRRLLLVIPVLIGVTFLVFSIVRLIPGDPAQAIAGEFATPELIQKYREELGLDQPMLKQYVLYMNRAVQGDFGKSLRSGVAVGKELKSRLPNTLKLTMAAMAVAAVIGIPAGILSATRANSWFDSGSMALALLGISMPVFWLGLMLMLFFAIKLPQYLGLGAPIFPPTGTGTWKHLVMPTLTLGANSMAILARMTRSTMLEVLRRDFVRTARAKGLAERMVVYKHALKNALIPIVTVIGLQFGTLLGGAVLTETVFTWPGIGRLIVDGILHRDYPLVQATALVISVGVVFVNLTVDLIYGLLDPRIRYT
jgi:peptide/nickel transport system permease protein